MATTANTKITVSTKIHAGKERVWTIWTDPHHITIWNAASEDWHTTKAENDLQVGGKFLFRMEAKDGSMGFDFEGTYKEINIHDKIVYQLTDERDVEVTFQKEGVDTIVTETFEAEHSNSVELQKGGWQAILNHFKDYVEGLPQLETLHFEKTILAEPETGKGTKGI